MGEILDRALLNRAATATVRSLLTRVADSMVAGEGAAGLAPAEGTPPESARWQMEPEAT